MSEFPSEYDVLRDVTERLSAAEIPYMLTGSLALNFYVEPRMTRDIDLVVEIGQRSAASVAAIFHPEYYASEEGIADAIAHGTLFNLIHHAAVMKVDCILRKDTPFGLQQFRRRQSVQLRGFQTWIASKEDLIVAKLSWFAESHSERQLQDLRHLAASGFDEAYVLACVRDLGLRSHWSQLETG